MPARLPSAPPWDDWPRPVSRIEFASDAAWQHLPAMRGPEGAKNRANQPKTAFEKDRISYLQRTESRNNPAR